MNSRNFSLVEGLVIAAIVLILVALGWGAYSESKRPNITLKKDEWKCTKNETRTHLQPIGKVLMPMNKQVCIEYRRIGG